MNREIKFRFWLTGINKMTYDHDLPSIGKVFRGGISDMIALQFTGVEDKFGTHIYEGHIVQDSELTYQVCFGDWYDGDSEHVGFYLKDIITGMDGVFGKGDGVVLEVIGNIFENKELLHATT